MLALRPNCECCDKDLPPDAQDAFICSYECTFCKNCVDNTLSNVCPNCGGGFSPRPIRPKTEYRKGVSLSYQKPSRDRKLTAYSREEIKQFSESIKDIDASKR